MSLLKTDKRAWKNEFFAKFLNLLDEYPSCLIVGADNISSNQMQKIRMTLRGKAVVLMGKNTMIRKALLSHVQKNPNVEKIIPYIRQNVGFVFTKENLRDVKDRVSEHRVKAPAKVGAIAPLDVFIQAQQTKMGPEKTSFFQALQISTKITKGCVEILNDVHLIKKGQIVGASEAALLNMLNVLPFEYTLQVRRVFDHGACFDPFVLDIKKEDIISRMKAGAEKLAMISVALQYPNKSSAKLLLHMAFRKMLAAAVASEVEFDEVKGYTDILNDPTKLADMAAASAPAKSEEPSKAEAKKAAAAEESESSDEEEGMFGLFE